MIRPLAATGPGRQARLSMLAALVLGLAAVGAGFAIGYDSATRKVAFGSIEPAWVTWLVPGGVLFGFAGLAFAGFIKLAVTRNTALLIGEDGAVCYGSQVLVASGEAAAVCLDRRSRWTRTTTSEGVQSGPRYELKRAFVYVVTTAGRLVEMPAPYFSDFKDWPTAEALAAALAESLGAPVTTELPPGPDPNPCPTVLRHRAAGLLVLAFGTVAVVVGAMLVLAHGAAVATQTRPPAKFEWWAGLPFVAMGGLVGRIGCGLLEWGWRRWLVLLAAQITAGGFAVVAINWFT